MTDRDLEQKLQDALEHTAPDDFGDVLSRRGTEKRNVIHMTNMTANTCEKKKRSWPRGLIAACLTLALLGAGTGGGMWYRANWSVASIISLDVNPSIELQVNQNEKVLSCTARNEDAATVLSDMDGGQDLEGTKLDVAVNAIVGALVRHGYLDSLSSAILISVEDNNTSRAAQLQQQITATVDGILQTSSSQAAVYSQNMAMNAGLDAQARANNISSGKAALVNQVIALNRSLKFEELAKLSVEELRDLMEIGAPGMPIGREAAVSNARNYAGTLTQNADVLKEVDSDLDDALPHYEVELIISGREYDYKVDAFTGEVLSGTADVLETLSPTPSGSLPVPPQPVVTDIGQDAAKAAALAHAGAAENNVTWLKVQKDWDDGRTEYELEFIYGSTEYEYTIDAANGTILKYETEKLRQPDPSSGGTTDIGQDAAKAAALAHAGIAESQITHLEVEQDWDDGRLEYEVEFKSGGYEYEYTIDAATGAVLEHEKDWDD
ncbi:PepSY domain-containing protein [uncultured Dysosmobacter sp.]|uniref:PepSY domain-containing protein n=1 Tax=uncultured Dysosmobacter sp. TaxID=2591384 RepID=UPI00261E1F31|nr:PepSY domain-containing protein [uncultured Dysosmobacter sp.]